MSYNKQLRWTRLSLVDSSLSLRSAVFFIEKAIGAVDCPEEYKGLLKTGVINFNEILERLQLAQEQLDDLARKSNEPKT